MRIYVLSTHQDTTLHKPDTSYTKDDLFTAKEFLNNASALIWLIGLDANGTISSNDLDFLSQLNLEHKKLFIVLNKADLRAQNDLEDIMQEVAESLDDYDIDFMGISAFSSLTKKEYAYKKYSLMGFLQDCNYESEYHKKLLDRLMNVYSMYKLAIRKNIEEKKVMKSYVKSISLDLIEEGFDDMTKPAFQRLKKLEKIFTTKVQENNLKNLDTVIMKLKTAIDHVFGKKHKIDLKKIGEDIIKIDFDLEIEKMEDSEDLDIIAPKKKRKVRKKPSNSDSDTKDSKKQNKDGLFGLFSDSVK